MKAVPRTADNIHIPLKESEALRLMLKVKPTADMPRPGANRPKSIVREMDEQYGSLKPSNKRAKKIAR